MPAPAIIGAARIVGGKVAKGSGRKAVAGSRVKKGRASLSQGNPPEHFVSLDDKRTDINRLRRGFDHIRRFKSEEENGQASKTEVLLKQVKASQASIMIGWSAIWFAIPQVVFWVVGIVGIGGESVPLFNYIFPGQVVYMFSYTIIVVIGICTMLYATWIYVIRKIDCFGGYKSLFFILSFTGYFVIFINLFPWFIVWLFAVSYIQKKSS